MPKLRPRGIAAVRFLQMKELELRLLDEHGAELNYSGYHSIRTLRDAWEPRHGDNRLRWVNRIKLEFPECDQIAVVHFISIHDSDLWLELTRFKPNNAPFYLSGGAALIFYPGDMVIEFADPPWLSSAEEVMLFTWLDGKRT